MKLQCDTQNRLVSEEKTTQTCQLSSCEVNAILEGVASKRALLMVETDEANILAVNDLVVLAVGEGVAYSCVLSGELNWNRREDQNSDPPPQCSSLIASNVRSRLPQEAQKEAGTLAAEVKQRNDGKWVKLSTVVGKKKKKKKNERPTFLAKQVSTVVSGKRQESSLS